MKRCAGIIALLLLACGNGTSLFITGRSFCHNNQEADTQVHPTTQDLEGINIYNLR